ncbi:DUF1838 family protein [Sphingomonas sp. 28-63-12]|uniref:DUF1838 family protein n=1 Tax=Sphingomonas sp. 28-63-12 TaxID=1970434 RepID=UPI000BD31BEF|nr:MAG: hypothetical protein B7Y47_02170 [Sphingomonas sp. 28-63-12]
MTNPVVNEAEDRMTAHDGIGRRAAMGLIGCGAAVGSMALAAPSGARVAGARRSFNFADPAEQLRAFMMMRGALDDRLVIGGLSGRYFGVVGAQLTPMFGVVSATFTRYRPAPGGGYEAVGAEFAYFTDPVSGVAIGPYRNPYTGETVMVPSGGTPLSRIFIGSDMALRLESKIPGLSFENTVSPPEVRGNDVWFSELTRTSSPVPGKAEAFHYSESTILHARLNELNAFGAKRVRCETNFTNVVSWRPWLKMESHPGHMMAVGVGSYGRAVNELPAAWIAATRVHHPELLVDPASVLAPLWNAK